MKKRILSMLLSVAMVASMFSVLSITAFAANVADLPAGTLSVASGVTATLHDGAAIPAAVDTSKGLAVSADRECTYLTGDANELHVGPLSTPKLFDGDASANCDGWSLTDWSKAGGSIVSEDESKWFATITESVGTNSTINQILVVQSAAGNNVLGHYKIYAGNSEKTLYSEANLVADWNALNITTYSSDMRTQLYTFDTPITASYIGMKITTAGYLPADSTANNELRIREFNAYGTGSGISIIRQANGFALADTEEKAENLVSTRPAVFGASVFSDGRNEYVPIKFTQPSSELKAKLVDGETAKGEFSSINLSSHYTNETGDFDAYVDIAYDLRDQYGNGANISGIVATLGGGGTSRYAASVFNVYVSDSYATLFNPESIVAQVDEWSASASKSGTYIKFKDGLDIAKGVKFVAIRMFQLVYSGADKNNGIYPRLGEFAVYGTRDAFTPDYTVAYATKEQEESAHIGDAEKNLLLNIPAYQCDGIINGEEKDFDTKGEFIAKMIDDDYQSQNSSLVPFFTTTTVTEPEEKTIMDLVITDDPAVNCERLYFELPQSAAIDGINLTSFVGSSAYMAWSHAKIYITDTQEQLFTPDSLALEAYNLDTDKISAQYTLNTAVTGKYIGLEIICGLKQIDAVNGFGEHLNPTEAYWYTSRISSFEVFGAYVGGTPSEENVTAVYDQNAPASLASITKSELFTQGNADKNGVTPSFVTITADAAPEGTTFDGWYNNGVKVSSDLAYNANASTAATYTATYALDFTAATVTGVEDQTYTGDEITLPNLEVSFGGSTLIEDTNYEVAYTNNTAIGTATVTITGKGAYVGTIEKTFSILAISIADAQISDIDPQDYTGDALEPDVTVTLNGSALTALTDYTVEYLNNTNAGTATVKVTGYGNYSGNVTKDFTINPISLATATVEGIENAVYTGEAITLSNIAVTLDGTGLVLGTDFTVSYQDNVNAGTASVTITGCGNYKDQINKSFDIAQFDLANATVSGIANKTYTGKALTTTFTVSGTKISADDYTVAYKNNKNVGTATVTLTGKENCIGTKSFTFKITAKKVTPTVTGAKNKVYTGKALTQSLTVKAGSVKLKLGTDYTVAYKNNKSVGLASAVVTLKGNYSGTKTVTFAITPKKQATPKVTAGKKKLTVKWSKVTGATGYQVQYCTKSSFKGAKTVKLGKVTSKAISKLKAKTKYYVRIRTVAKIGGKTYYGAWSSSKSAKTK